MLIIKKKKKNHDKIKLLAKMTWNKVLNFQSLIKLYISHYDFISLNVLGECNEMKEEIKNP